jgi:hypothetical protein
MRPEPCNCSQASGTLLQTPTLIGCILLKNCAVQALLTCVQRRGGIMRFFALPCQALGSPHLREPCNECLLPGTPLRIAKPMTIAPFPKLHATAVVATSQSTWRGGTTRALKRLRALRAEGRFGSGLRFVSCEYSRQCRLQFERIRTQDHLFDGGNLPWVHRKAAQAHR